MSGVRLSRELVPGMVERGWGRIIFISSEFGVQIPPEMVHYGVTKTAQLALSRGIAESVRVPALRRTLSFPDQLGPKALSNSSASWRMIRVLTWRISSATSSRPCAPPPSLAASRRRKKWRTWWCSSAVKDLPLLPVPHSELTEAWCGVLSDAMAWTKSTKRFRGSWQAPGSEKRQCLPWVKSGSFRWLERSPLCAMSGRG